MKKILLALGATLGLASAQTAAPVSAPVAEQPTAQRSDSTTARTPKAPAQPVTAPTRHVRARQLPLAHLGTPRFIEQPRLRKVKYGKARWIWLS